MLTDPQRDELVAYLNQFKGKEAEVIAALKSGKWSTYYEKVVVEKWIEERKAEKEEEKRQEYIQLVKESNNNAKRTTIISIVVGIATFMAAFSALFNAQQVKLANKVELRPYVIIEPAGNALPHNGSGFVTLPYQLVNKGKAPALSIHKGYTSYILDESGNQTKIQGFEEPLGKVDALAPAQSSAIHMDQINITGVNSSNIEHVTVKVELKIKYQGFEEVDDRRYYSKAIFVLIPKKMENDKVVFIVAQPYLDFGFENNVLKISREDDSSRKTSYKESSVKKQVVKEQ